MLHVEGMRDIEATTWDRLLVDSPGGHVLQTHAWDAFKETQGWQPVRLALKDGDRVVGVAQMAVRPIPGVAGAIAYCGKGPWIDWADPAAVRTMLQGMEYFARKRGASILLPVRVCERKVRLVERYTYHLPTTFPHYNSTG